MMRNPTAFVYVCRPCLRARTGDVSNSAPEGAVPVRPLPIKPHEHKYANAAKEHHLSYIQKHLDRTHSNTSQTSSSVGAPKGPHAGPAAPA